MTTSIMIHYCDTVILNSILNSSIEISNCKNVVIGITSPPSQKQQPIKNSISNKFKKVNNHKTHNNHKIHRSIDDPMPPRVKTALKFKKIS